MGKASRRHWSIWFKRLVPIFALGVFVLAITFLVRTFGEHSFADVSRAVLAIPTSDLAKAIALTFFSYLVLCLYDLMGARYVGTDVGTGKVFFTSFTAYAFSNSIGLSSLAGHSLRFRLYSTFGLEPGQIVKVIVFVTTTFWVGFLSISGIAMLSSPIPLPEKYGIPASLSTTIGIVALVLAVAYVVTCGVFRRTIEVKGEKLELPHPGLAILQALTAAFDWILAAGVLYYLLPHDQMGFFAFLTIFVSAQVVALVSNVPGGVGILEALVIYFMSANHQPTPAILGGLLAYRMIYYIAPLVLAAVFFFGHEARLRLVKKKTGAF